MSPLLATCLCCGAYLLAYRFYARYLARRLFELGPAHRRPRIGGVTRWIIRRCSLQKQGSGAFSLIEKKTPDPCFQLFIKKPG